MILTLALDYEPGASTRQGREPIGPEKVAAELIVLLRQHGAVVRRCEAIVRDGDLAVMELLRAEQALAPADQPYLCPVRGLDSDGFDARCHHDADHEGPHDFD